MAKITIELDDEEPEDLRKLRRYTKSIDLCLVLWDIGQYLRKERDDGQKPIIGEETFWDMLEMKGINLEELIE